MRIVRDFDRVYMPEGKRGGVMWTVWLLVYQARKCIRLHYPYWNYFDYLEKSFFSICKRTSVASQLPGFLWVGFPITLTPEPKACDQIGGMSQYQLEKCDCFTGAATVLDRVSRLLGGFNLRYHDSYVGLLGRCAAFIQDLPGWSLGRSAGGWQVHSGALRLPPLLCSS